MSLPLPWVKRIFARMTMVYGTNFTRQWEGLDLDAVMDDWAHELRGFQQSPDAISHGLSVIDPDKPPNVLQFKALCLKAPQYAPKALPAPKADPAIVEAVIGAFKRSEGFDPKAWAHNLKEREESGEKLGLVQRQFWREALEAQ